MVEDNITTYSLEVSNLLVSLDMPRITAAVIGLLLASQPPELTFEDVQKKLNISKAAVSSAMRYLEALDVVTYKTPIGSRKRLIRLEPLKLANYIKRRMVFFGRLTYSLQMIAQDQSEDTYKQEIARLANLCQKLDTAVREIISEWEEEQV
ncbi:hypothetical protein BFT35_01670 [Thermoanaerobacterium thermosaccharolyticum]|nr:hypothetical protein BFT35_01670 [Thermoanaerobacterium thermosaccharolyticum]